MIREIERSALSGWPVLAGILTLDLLGIYAVVTMIRSGDSSPVLIGVAIWATVLVSALLVGLFIVNPNEGKVLQLFGKYVGTAKTPGLRWANPFYSKRRVSLRIRNF